jgi:hypothetical protein
MKLQTDIAPRRDGKLTTLDNDGQAIVFEKDAGGILTAEVQCQETLERLLRTGNFYPADEADFKEAEQLLESKTEAQPEDDDGDDFEGDEEAPLLDANTPPKPPRAKPAAKTKAKA